MTGRRLGYVLKRFPRISETFVATEIIELERQGEEVTIFAVSRPEEAFTHRFLDELRAPVVYLPHRPSRQPVRVARAVGFALRGDARAWGRVAVASVWPPRRAGVRRLLQASVLHQEMARAGITHAHAHFATAAARLANLNRPGIRAGSNPWNPRTQPNEPARDPGRFIAPSSASPEAVRGTNRLPSTARVRWAAWLPDANLGATSSCSSPWCRRGPIHCAS